MEDGRNIPENCWNNTVRKTTLTRYIQEEEHKQKEVKPLTLEKVTTLLENWDKKSHRKYRIPDITLSCTKFISDLKTEET